jgi:hypothetical protein
MRNSQSLHWMGVMKWVLILGMGSILGLSYMFCKNQNMRLADETHQLRLKLEAIERHNTALALDLEMMKSPDLLKRRLVQMGSTLVPLYDPRMLAHVMRMEGQSTRMRLEPKGTDTPIDINIDSDHVTAANSSSEPAMSTPDSP